MRVKHRSVGAYSGAIVYGDARASVPTGPTAEYHAERAYWLTGEVETQNRLGSVMMADGTAFTIGRDQHIAVYPAELAHEDWNAEDDQGGAWELLAKLEVSKSAFVQPLWDAFEHVGWYVSQTDGRCRWLAKGESMVNGRRISHEGGDLVHGAVIRDTMTPPQGKVPATGARWDECVRWCGLLHDLTADPATADLQKAFGLQQLNHGVQARKLPGMSKTIQKAIYGDTPFAALVVGKHLGGPLDLALCVLHSHSVNAPAIAYRKLAEVVDKWGWDPSQLGTMRERTLACDLLDGLRTCQYARWEARWARTYEAAQKSGLWGRDLFEEGGVMKAPA